LELDIGQKPSFQILPGFNFIVQGSGTFCDVVQISLQDLVDQAFLALKIMVKLALSRTVPDSGVRYSRAGHSLVNGVRVDREEKTQNVGNFHIRKGLERCSIPTGLC
jgi:hypothetical protein